MGLLDNEFNVTLLDDKYYCADSFVYLTIDVILSLFCKKSKEELSIEAW